MSFCDLDEKNPLRQWDWGFRLDEGDSKPCHRWSHGYSKAPHEGSDWYSHPHTFSIITTTACVGDKCFPFWCFLSRGGPKLCPVTIAAIGDLSCSPTLILIAVLSLFSLEVNYSATHSGGWPRIHWLMRTSATFCLAFSSQTQEAWLHLHPLFAAPRP